MKRTAAFLLIFAGLIGPLRADEVDDRQAWQFVQIVRDPMTGLAARVQAARALGKMGPKAAAAVPDLTRLLPRLRETEMLPLQEAIIHSLGQIGNPSRPSLPALMLEYGRNLDIDLALRRTTEQIAQAADAADLPTLLRQLRHKDESLRLRAAKALAKFGPPAKPAVADLTIALQDDDADVRRAALAALHAIEPNVKLGEAEVNVYALELQDPDPANRLRAIKALAALGPAAAVAAPALQALSEDRDPDVRRAVNDVLGKLPPPK